jgi:anthranilate phosphoribosyltransferase
MGIQHAIARATAANDLTGEEMDAAMRAIMEGEATPAQIAGLLVALRMKGETAVEVAAAARVMREFAVRVDVEHEHLVDIVGTGGDGCRTFNVSTAAAFVVAAAGGRVAKHNNRAVSSRCGSADLLEAAGVRIDLSPAEIAACVEKVGVGFMFAPQHHGATRHAAGPRRELAVRTIFNLLGPLTNPAGVRNLLIGVYHRDRTRLVAEVMKLLGGRHVLVVHSEDGLDEISIAAPTYVAELKGGEVREYVLEPEDVGLRRSPLDGIRVQTREESLRLVRSALAGEPGAALDIVLLNAGAAIHAAGLEPDLRSGIERARAAVTSGGAARKLEELVALTRSFAREGNPA